MKKKKPTQKTPHIPTSVRLYCLMNFTSNSLATPPALHEKAHFFLSKKLFLYLQTLMFHLLYMAGGGMFSYKESYK